MLSLHRLLFKQSDPISFHAEILPRSEHRTALTLAKNEIRDHLRVTLGRASVAHFGMKRQVEPRFRTQGSWSYNICVLPAHAPPQEIDWDFGVYLPATIWQGTQPAFAAKTYFEIVESSLKDLCKRKGWRLATGENQKDSCIRIVISRWAHIDVPLYAAPEAQFHRISELATSAAFAGRSREADLLREFAEDAEIVDWPWDQLQEVHMAKRTGEWVPSDPFRVTRWFLDAVDEHPGEQLRRVCRYLKAWRDYHWPNGGGPTSVMLMICACEDFEVQHHRDDIALQVAAERLSRMLLKDIRVRAIDNNEENFNRLGQTERSEASSKAADLRWAIELSRGFGTSLRLDALRKIQSALGPRVPNDVSMIEDESVADRVRAVPASTVAAPNIPNTRSG